MAGLNKVFLIGNLTRDPELRYSQQGSAVVNFSMATNEFWTDKNTGQKQEKVEFHRCVVFGKQAETINQYCGKGNQLYVEGQLQTRQWEKDGQNHYTTEIVVRNFQFLGGGQQQSGGRPSGGQGQQGGQGQYHQGQNQGYQQQNQQQGGGYQNQGGYQQQGPTQGEGPQSDDIPF